MRAADNWTSPHVCARSRLRSDADQLRPGKLRRGLFSWLRQIERQLERPVDDPHVRRIARLDPAFTWARFISPAPPNDPLRLECRVSGLR